jgi:hypothetical protein
MPFAIPAPDYIGALDDAAAIQTDVRGVVDHRMAAAQQVTRHSAR